MDGLVCYECELNTLRKGVLFNMQNLRENRKITDSTVEDIEKYTNKKLKNEVFSELIEGRISNNAHRSVQECGSYLLFGSNLVQKKDKLLGANFCKNRFCPVCARRISIKIAEGINTTMSYLNKEKAQEFLFLTLTVPNCTAEQLNDTIKHINKSFDKMFRRAEVKNSINGFIRKLEVTYQSEPIITKELYRRKKKYYDHRGLGIGDKEPNYNTYHPHFHVILSVDKSYLTNAKKYITKAKWLKLWQQATGDNSITQVDIKRVYTGDSNSIQEISKYSAKDSDYLISQEVFDVFYHALKGKQLITYGGYFKDAIKLYKQRKLEEYREVDRVELTHLKENFWNEFDKKYQQTLRVMTDDEYIRYNRIKNDYDIEGDIGIKEVFGTEGQP